MQQEQHGQELAELLNTPLKTSLTLKEITEMDKLRSSICESEAELASVKAQVENENQWLLDLEFSCGLWAPNTSIAK